MSAVFHCETTFTIPSRCLFVLSGRIQEGRVGPGMKIGIPTPSGVLRFCLINSIEHVSKSQEHDFLGLTVLCADKDEMTTLEAMAIRDIDCVVCALESLITGSQSKNNPESLSS